MERQLRLPQLGMKIRGADGWGKINSVNRRGNRKGQPSPAKRRNEAATKFQFQLFIYIFIFYFFANSLCERVQGAGCRETEEGWPEQKADQGYKFHWL